MGASFGAGEIEVQEMTDTIWSQTDGGSVYHLEGTDILIRVLSRTNVFYCLEEADSGRRHEHFGDLNEAKAAGEALANERGLL